MSDKALLHRAVAFVISTVRHTLDSWIDENCLAFSNADDEHRLEYTALFKEYEVLLEDELETFVRSEGFESNNEFLRFLHEANDDLRGNRYIRAILVSLDYERFVTLMCLRAKSVRREQSKAQKAVDGNTEWSQKYEAGEGKNSSKKK